MKVKILLLKVDSDQEPQGTDLHPPSYDIFGHFLVDGAYDAVALVNVPNGLDLVERNRFPMDGQIYLIREVLSIYEPPPTDGVTRW